MRVKDLIKLEIKIDSVWVDYTNGVLEADIVRGIQSTYIGPWQQCESGVLTLSSRNENLDPYVNSNIRMNKDIRVLALDEPIFTGRINGINVDYQPKGEPPIITISAVDMIGTMALHTLRDTFKDRLGTSMDLNGMFQELEACNGSDPTTYPSEYEIIGFTNPYRSAGALSDAGSASNGITALKMATILSQGNLDFFYADRTNDVYLYPSAKQKRDDLPKLQLDSRGGATSYRAIDLTDGFDLLKNKISISSYGTTIPTYTNNFSVTEWGAQGASVEVYYPGVTGQNSDTTNLANTIFQDTANPTREIASITFDGELAPDDVHTIDILDNVYIYHEVNGFDIARKYGIVGMHHRISANDWEITYNLRNMFTYETVFPTPVVTSSPLNGTILDTYTFTITNLADIEHQNATYIWKDNSVTFSTAESPTKTYNLAGVGAHNITCTVTDDYGFTKTSSAYVLNVYGTAPTGVSFTHTPDPANSALIQFVATATNAVSYSWDFGDGTTGVGQTTAHLYSTSGSKTVILSAINPYGTTTSTQTFSVTVPPTPSDEVGTLGIRYVKLGMNYFNAGGEYWPLMNNFRALTSTTLTNRAATNRVIQSAPYQTNGEPSGNHEWRKFNDTLSDVPYAGICNSTLLQNYTGSGIKPWNTISGTANWGLIVDMQSLHYDIKTFKMLFDGSAAVGAPTSINVYATTDGVYNGFNDADWRLIGSISRVTGNFTPKSGLTFPLDIGDI